MTGGNCNLKCEGGPSLLICMEFAYICNHPEGSKVLLPSMQLVKHAVIYSVVLFQELFNDFRRMKRVCNDM